MSYITKTKINNIVVGKHGVNDHVWNVLEVSGMGSPVTTVEFECDGVSGCGAHKFEYQTEVETSDD